MKYLKKLKMFSVLVLLIFSGTGCLTMFNEIHTHHNGDEQRINELEERIDKLQDYLEEIEEEEDEIDLVD